MSSTPWPASSRSSFVKRCAVIDGMNLLHTASRGCKADRFVELDAIVFLVTAREFLSRDFDVRIFLPLKRLKFVKNKNVVRDLDHLDIFEFTYSNYDDVLILQYAAQAGGFVISRDKFRDILPRVSTILHVMERCCHLTFLHDENCRMSLTIGAAGEEDQGDTGKDSSEEREDPEESEERVDITPCLALNQSTVEDENLRIFYSHEGDFDFSATRFTRSFSSSERRRAALGEIEEALERLYYYARTRESGLSLTSLIYLKCYFRPDDLEEAFRVIRSMGDTNESAEVVHAKEEVKFWFSKSVRSDVVDYVLRKNPSTFAEVLNLCNEKLKEIYDFSGKRSRINERMQMYDDLEFPKQVGTEHALAELDL